MTLDQFLGLFNYWVVIVLMMTGFYIVISSGNLIKTVIGLNIFQISVILLYITMGKVTPGTAPILLESHGHHAAHHESESDHHEPADKHHLASHDKHHHTDDGHSSEKIADDSDHATHDDSDHAGTKTVYSNPLPSVLMLTAIVVGVATTALALALIVRVREDYGSIEEDEILALDANGLANGLSSSANYSSRNAS
jgi:multicomponent Na+:H+ antiporter subunit C